MIVKFQIIPRNIRILILPVDLIGIAANQTIENIL